jgi:hypothetical protein
MSVKSSWGFRESILNSFFGINAGSSNISGGYNSFFGNNAGYYNSAGGYNSFFGYAAGFSNDSGSYNSFVGNNAGHSNSSGSYNSFVGNNAGYSNVGNYNAFVGDSAGYYNSGGNNSFVGHNAGYNNGSGGSNSFIGDYAGFSNTTGSSNSCFGDSAGYNNQTGSNNVFIGRNAGFAETGSNKLYIDNGINSSPLIYGDFSAGTLTVTGTLNATNFAGNGAGLTNINVAAIANGVLTTGSYADPPWLTSLAGTKVNGAVANATSCTYTSEIGSISSNYIPRWNGIQMVTGMISDNGTVAEVKGTLVLSSVASVSDERFKKNIQPLQQSLDKVIKLTGVSYDWKTEEYSGMGFTTGRQIGLIAQEVEAVFPELVLTDDNSYKAVAYDKLVPVLIEAVKEQQESINQQQSAIKQQLESIIQKDFRIEMLEKTLRMMEQRLTSLENQSQ